MDVMPSGTDKYTCSKRVTIKRICRRVQSIARNIWSDSYVDVVNKDERK